jgi:D-alanyl-D-alanine dipeptidase
MNKKRSVPIKYVEASRHGFIVEPRYFFFGWTKSSKILGRESALKALVKARRFLPKGYNFKIWDCKRTYQVQACMMESFLRRLRLLYPKLNAKKLNLLLTRFSGGLVKNIKRLDTHRKGGAFDLTIVDRNGDELFMGTDHDDLTARAATDFFETKKHPSQMDLEAKKDRRLLKRVMKRAGFENYAVEWWHWSYFDPVRRGRPIDLAINTDF